MIMIKVTWALMELNVDVLELTDCSRYTLAMALSRLEYSPSTDACCDAHTCARCGGS